ncbi:MAG: hypothetical protein B7X90_09245 [Novosphingobium sp. 17-62-19]|uniref:hypothetical protein n=1 Tax=Novosphingobium sp. 17-62-19 TaxID=1970406 RepID=UPI000BCB8296|nr:hypothetical protein [Novosphingobium sp. 17-62-19]OZA19308.1 MAG: hypothetical protein B7X90_09245 [Novosphingobium sp. 17-62-19]HQS95379.1 hypothetical protein [Novosphingobium sp.]
MTYTLAWRPAQVMEDVAEAPFDVWRDDDGTASTMFHRTPNGFLVRFLDGGDFAIDLVAKKITCTPVPDVSEDYVLNLYSNQILPLLWTYNGTPVLHASCVVIDGGAYGFLGRSGRGKSTLAAAFARQGHAFLTDDGMVIEADGDCLSVRPYLASVRLLPDSQGALLGDGAVDVDEDDDWTPKVRVPASALIPHADEPAPLKAIYVLEEPVSDEAVFRALSVPAGIDALLQHSFLLDSHDKVRVRTHFKAMAELAEAYPMFALDYPRDFDRIGEIVSAITSHARQRDV